jgi:hypothetical protein
MLQRWATYFSTGIQVYVAGQVVGTPTFRGWNTVSQHSSEARITSGTAKAALSLVVVVFFFFQKLSFFVRLAGEVALDFFGVLRVPTRGNQILNISSSHNSHIRTPLCFCGR